jgi:hypothetical protein
MHAEGDFNLLARPSIQKMDDEWEGIKDAYIDRFSRSSYIPSVSF